MKKITRELVAKWMPTRKKDAYKNKMGHILCVGGNAQMGGAIILCASAALNSGAGLVTIASAPENLHALHARHPEAMFVNMYNEMELRSSIEKADAVVLGPGLGLSKESFKVFNHVIQTIQPHQWLVIDGDAITHLVNENARSIIDTDNLVLTPHLGEWQRLTEITPPARAIDLNHQKQKELQAIVVLKKERTEIYFEDQVWQNTAGNPSMATGGMGDTLTGILAGFLGQFENKQEAILSAVYVHSAVADEQATTHYVTLPSKLIEFIPVFMKSLNNYQ